MATVTASLSSRVDARGKAEILLRFVGGRDHVYRLHSGLYVQPSRWRDGAVVVPRLAGSEQRELRTLEKQLADLGTFLIDGFARADQDSVDRRAMQQLVSEFHHPGRALAADFFTAWDAFVAGKEISVGRRKRYDVVRGALQRFQDQRQEPLALGTEDAATLEAFREWLVNEPGHDRRSRNVVVDYLKAVRAFWRWALERGLTRNDPFIGFKIGVATYGTPYYLTIEERDAIYALDLGRIPRLEVQRDIFIFQCMTGCRYGDLSRFVKGDVVDGVLTYIPRKTGEGNPVVVRVPLTSTARAIVEKYAPLRGDRLLPCISNQKYNYAIREICERAELTRPVTVLDPVTRQEVKRPLCEVASSHLARRTFVGNLYRKVKDPAIVGSLSGHAEGSRAFTRYRDIGDDIRREVVDLLEK